MIAYASHSDTVTLVPGLNLVGIPIDAASTPDTYSLIQQLGTQETINKLQRLNHSAGVFETTNFDTGGNPSSVNATIAAGEGWLVFASTVSTVEIATHISCPSTELLPGLNVVGMACAPIPQTAYELLIAIGDATVVSSVQTFDTGSGKFLTTAYQNGVPAGPDFPIERKRAYLIHMLQAATPILLKDNPTITSFAPTATVIGDLVNISGENLDSGVPTIVLNRVDGDQIHAPLLNLTATEIGFVVPPGAATGNITLDYDTQTLTTADLLMINASRDFTLSAVPATGSVIQGESTVYSVTLDSANGFNQLADLTVVGLPLNATATFTPHKITAGQLSKLEIRVPSDQVIDISALIISASTTVDGIELLETANATLEVLPITTTFKGQAVISDALQTPLEGVTITFLGRDGDGNPTGCDASTISDAAGNFVFFNLPPECQGNQLVRYDGLTVTNQPGDYAGVDLVYNITNGAVTTSPVLVHLPRIDNAETVMVKQNWPEDQFFTFTSIPNIEITVYAKTTFTLVSGSQPNPFPLIAVQVPIDRLPEEMPLDPDRITPFIVAFQPANAEASQAVAVTFPNNINVAPGTNMPLSTLDPTKGIMVDYGTGTVSADGTKIVPDLNPATPGKRYGLVHFDWHGPRPMPDPGNDDDPCNTCPCPQGGKPVDIASGLEVINEVDIAINNGGRGDISIQRTLRTYSTSAGPFGLGSNHNYGLRLVTNNPLAANVINLIMPDGNRFPFAAVGDGTFINQAIPSLRGAVMSVSANNEVDLRWKNGTVFHFIPSTVVLGSVLETITDSNGNAITLVRNPSNAAQIISIVDPVGRRLQLTYDTGNRITSITDPIGRTVLYTYTSVGRIDTVTDVDGGVTQYTYDAQNRLTQITDARGVVIAKNTYDAFGRIIMQEQADGGVYQFGYTLMNPNLRQSPVIETVVTDPRSNQTTYRFSPEGMLVDVTDPLGRKKVFEREFGSNFLEKISGTGQCSVCGNTNEGDVTFTYDAFGNIKTRTNQLGETTSYTYEPIFNKVASITDALGNTATLTYDEFGNLLTSTDQNNNVTEFVYDAHGQVVEEKDAKGEITKFEYDHFGNLVAVIEALGHKTTYQYDAISRRIETTDALDRKTKTQYDDFNRVIETTDARGNSTTIDYDSVGNRLSVTDARGNAIQFSYDPMNRVKTRTDSLGNIDTRSYDLNGNLVQFVDRRGLTNTFVYDELNRLTMETYDDGAVVERSYDVHDRLIQAIDSTSGTFSFEYDSAGRLLTAIGPNGTVKYLRDALDRVDQRQVVGQAPVDYDYDPVGNLLSAVTPQAGVNYGFDERNLPLTITRSNGVTTDYSYDALGRVLSITHANNLNTIENLAYVYDAVGNRISKTSTIAGPIQTQPSINSVDALSNQMLQHGSTTFTYDKNGNRLTENNSLGTTDYTWDARNRLTSIITPTQVVNFKYDFAGNLITKEDGVVNIGVNTITKTENYILDEITNVVAQSDTLGNQYNILTGQTIDQHLALVENSGQVEYGLTDAINSTVASVDTAGFGIAQFQYEPFGQTTVAGSNYPFQYTGRVPVLYDIYHYRARYYDSIDGRFISEDPIGLDGGDENVYRYVFNSPLNFYDPLGLKAKPQKKGCDGIPGWFETPCRLRACEKHDRCYTANCCDSSSWQLGKGTKACNKCNRDVLFDFSLCGDQEPGLICQIRF